MAAAAADPDPAVITIFRSRLRPGAGAAYEQEAGRMLALARAMPGFVDYSSYSAPDGERLTIVEFASDETHRAWREQPEHRVAQRRGRAEFYEYFRIDVCRRLHRSSG